MPKKLDRCVEKVKKQGKSEDSAWAICQSSINKSETTKSFEDLFFDELDSVKASAKDVERTSSGKIKYRGTTFPGFNKPRKSTKSEKKKMVLAKSGDKIKVVHYGATGYKHNYSPEAKRSFRARHKCGQQKDKLSAAYWACRDLWPTGSTKKSLVYKAEMKGDDPCWEGYEMVGHKTKGGKKVPNCVPKKETKKALGLPPFPSSDPSVNYSSTSIGEEFPPIPHGEDKTMKVVIPVPMEVGERIKMLRNGEKPQDMHITLAYLDEDSDCALVRTIVSEFTKTMDRSCFIDLTGVGRFNHEGYDVLYVSVDDPQLGFERERLVATLLGNGVKVDMEHGFNPHITVKYMDKGDETPKIEESALMDFPLTCVEVWQGPYRYRYNVIDNLDRGVF